MLFRSPCASLFATASRAFLTADYTSVRTEVKSAVKKAREAVANKDAQGVVEAVKLATKSLAKAGSKGVLHPRTASRRIGRLAKAAHAAKAAK